MQARRCSCSGLARCGFLCTLLLTVFLVGENRATAEGGFPTRHSPLDDEAPFRRFLWVTRWDYTTAKDVKRICYNAAAARFTDILFQVRGEGTVFFKSPLEPWAWELSGLGPENGIGKDPGWDPLATAIKEGRLRGLRVHAYLNVLPIWAQSVNPPKSSGQLYVAKPSWVMMDEEGRKMTPNGFYAFLDPGIPEVQEHLAKLFSQLVKDYNVDGVHLDYIRYPHENGEFSYNPRVVKDFKEYYGKNPSQDEADWNTYRCKQVTATVAKIREAINAARPGVELSAAVMADPIIRQAKGCQQPLEWLKRGLVDAVAPMDYVEDVDRFRELAAPFISAGFKSRVWLGIRALPKNDVMKQEIKSAVASGFAGVAIFSYEDLFKDHNPKDRSIEVYKTFMSLSSPPPPKQTLAAAKQDAVKRIEEATSAKKPTKVVAASSSSDAGDMTKIKHRSPKLKVKIE